MSEYMVCDTEITDIDALKEALVDIGVAEGAIEVHDTPVPLVGYQGDSRKQLANVVIRKRNVGMSSNDIGFEKTENGTYRAWVSDYDKRHGIGYKIINGEFKQVYAKRQVLRTVRGMRGWRVKSCETKDGKIKIRLAGS